MSQRNEVKDLTNLVGANLLDHYMTSKQEELKSCLETCQKIDFSLINRDVITKHMPDFMLLIAINSNENDAAGDLTYWVNCLIHEMKSRWPSQRLIDRYVPHVFTAMFRAVNLNFMGKNSLTDRALLSILSTVKVLQERSLIPEKYYKMLQMAEESEEGVV